MCPPSGPKAPPPAPKLPETPDPIPDPEPTAEAPVIKEGPGRTQSGKGAEAAVRKRGTQSLRINLNIPQASSSGLNVPKG